MPQTPSRRVLVCRLTNELRGRAEAPHGALGAQFFSARGAKPITHHGPFQRMLSVTCNSAQSRYLHVPAPSKWRIVQPEITPGSKLLALTAQTLRRRFFR